MGLYVYIKLLDLDSSSRQLLHLNAVSATARLPVLQRTCVAETHIAFKVGSLELHVAGHARAHKDKVPVLKPTLKGKRSVAILLCKLLAVDIFAGGLAAGHQEDMVGCQASREKERQASVDYHRECDAL